MRKLRSAFDGALLLWQQLLMLPGRLLLSLLV
jgi:hypothetical protein